MAYRRGDNDDRGLTGAILLAEGLDHLRIVARFCTSLAGVVRRRR